MTERLQVLDDVILLAVAGYLTAAIVATVLTAF